MSVSDQVALEGEARIAPLVSEKKKLFNDLLTSKGQFFLSKSSSPTFHAKNAGRSTWIHEPIFRKCLVGICN